MVMSGKSHLMETLLPWFANILSISRVNLTPQRFLQIAFMPEFFPAKHPNNTIRTT
jgi:hypothetical protein